MLPLQLGPWWCYGGLGALKEALSSQAQENFPGVFLLPFLATSLPLGPAPTTSTPGLLGMMF